MLQGFRWQLIALVLAIVLFMIGIAYRSSVQPMPQQTTTATSTPNTPRVTNTPIPESTQPILPTPFPNTPVPAVGQAGTSATYREGLVGSVHRINSIFAHLNSVDTDISSLIFEGLMKTNDFGEPILNLASEYIVSNDGLEYVFTLRDDILWQDGQVFSAEDVLYTMSLLSSPDYSKFSPIAKFWQTVETQKLSDHLVRFRLTQPLGSFPAFLTIGILPEHALRGISIDQLATHPFNLSPIGTGPYQLRSLHSSVDNEIDEINLVSAPVYNQRSEGQSGFVYRELTFRLYDTPADTITAYDAGQVDALANVASRSELMFLPNSRVYTQVESEVTVLLFNWQIDDRQVFADRRVRQALSLGLNQINIIERHLATDSAFADSPLIPGSWAYQPNLLWSNFDMSQATQLLESARIEPLEPVSDTEADTLPDEGSLYTFSIMVQDIDPLPAIAIDIASQWGQLGFDVSVDTVDITTYQARLESGEFQATIAKLPVGIDPDVYRYWHPGQYPGGQNYGGAANDEVAELLERARQDNNGVNRTNLYQQFQARFAEQAIAIPLYYPLYTFVARDSIEGIKLGFLGTSADRLRTISQWRPLEG